MKNKMRLTVGGGGDDGHAAKEVSASSGSGDDTKLMPNINRRASLTSSQVSSSSIDIAKNYLAEVSFAVKLHEDILLLLNEDQPDSIYLEDQLDLEVVLEDLLPSHHHHSNVLSAAVSTAIAIVSALWILVLVNVH
jgi:hypothetical protein